VGKIINILHFFSSVVILAMLVLIVQFSFGQEFTALSGDYLGLTLPGDSPVVFARGIISTDHHEHSAPAFSPESNEVFWSLWRRPKMTNRR
jgi:hypothetical protein